MTDVLKRILQLASGLAAGAWLALAAATPVWAQAQGSAWPVQGGPWTDLDATPSAKIMKGSPLSPANAVGFYGGSAVTAPTARPEITELARSLSDSGGVGVRVPNPDLVYEYVHNTIRTEFVFGAQKGSLGAIIDKSAGAFDQAELMVEILRAQGATANLRFGDITLSGSDFYAWSGVSSAQAACQLLAAGGIPAVVYVGGTGSTDGSCPTSGDLTNVMMAHVWVLVTIGGQVYEYDPSFKASEHPTGLDLRAAAGFTGGEAFTAATHNVFPQNSGKTVSQFDGPSLKSVVDRYSSSLVSALATPGAGGLSIGDVLGDDKIVAAVRPVGGYRTQALAYVTQRRVDWTNIPDKYRTVLTFSGQDSLGCFSKPVFADQVYGRRVDYANGPTAPLPAGIGSITSMLLIDHAIAAVETPGCAITDGYFIAKIDVQHPFAASGGAYGHDSFARRLELSNAPISVVLGLGRTGPELEMKWAREQATDLRGYFNTSGVFVYQGQGFSGDLIRARLGATWMAQAARSQDIQALLANSRSTNLHTIGFVLDISTSTLYAGGTYDLTNIIDVQSAFGLTSLTGDVTTRRAGLQAIAAASAALEGSIAEQTSDTPDSTSASRRLSWAVSPDPDRSGLAPDPEVYGTGPVKFYQIAAGDTLLPSASFTNSVSTPVNGNYDNRTTLLASMQAYHNGLFDISVASEAMLGPGSDRGSIAPGPPPTGSGSELPPTVLPSTQRGGAFVAQLLDSSGDPLQIAHVSTNYFTATKGGGGAAPPYDPKASADVLKDKFVERTSALGVDLKTGQAMFAPIPIRSTGQDEFPYRLEERLEVRGGALPVAAPDVFDFSLGDTVQGGVVSNWDSAATVSSSGLEGLGQSRVEAASSSLAAFIALQDIYSSGSGVQQHVAGALVTDWWTRHLSHNVVTISRGAGTEQYVEAGIEGGAARYLPSNGGPARVLVTWPLRIIRPTMTFDGNFIAAPYRMYLYDQISVQKLDGHGNTDAFQYWQLGTTDATSPQFAYGIRLNTETLVRGVTLTLGYAATAPGIPTSVTSSAGQSLALSPIPGQSLLPRCTALFQYYGNFTFFVGQDTNPTVFDRAITNANSETSHLRFTAPLQQSASQRPFEQCQPLEFYSPTDDYTNALPGLRYAYNTLGEVIRAQDGNQVRNTGLGAYNFYLASGYRGEREDPAGYRYAYETHPAGNVSSLSGPTNNVTVDTDELGNAVVSLFDARGRLQERDRPEGDRAQYTYDAADNTTLVQQLPKPGSAQTGQILAIHATWNPTWNKPATITDARNNTTTMNYVSGVGSGAGEILSVIRPGGISYGFGYNPAGRVTSVTDPTNVVTAYGYDPSNLLTSITLDPGAGHVASQTTFTNNPDGDPVAIDGPRTDLSDISHITYDAMRRKLLQIQADPGTGHMTARSTTYNADGRPIEDDQGYATGTGPFVFHALITNSALYDHAGNKVRETTPTGVTQFSFDAVNRLSCTAVRMNPTGALPDDACTPAVRVAAVGSDQITRNAYYGDGKSKTVTLGLTTDAQTDVVTREYTPNGQQQFVIDGACNVTRLSYDGFDRLQTVNFPMPGRGLGCTGAGAGVGHPGSYNPSDHEDYGYDENGNRTSLRKRDNSQFTYHYDPLDRQTQKTISTVPDGSQDVYRGYDGAGRLQYARYQSPAGKGITLGYDTAGRQTSETDYFWNPISWVLDPAGNRTQVTWPDSVASVNYTFDAAGRMISIQEPPGANRVGTLVTLHYDDLGRRTDILRGNGGHANYAYNDPDGRLTSLIQAGGASASAPSVQSISYTAANQVASVTQNTGFYVWQGQPTATAASAYNGLNQDAGVAALEATPGHGYDTRGNLVDNDIRDYTYDAESQMIFVGDGGHALGVAYDPLGRVRATHNQDDVWSFFLYAGSSEMVGEYADKVVGTPPLRRYVHGSGNDEPLVWYEGADYRSPRWLHADRQGSIIAWSDVSGGIGATIAYGPYGEPSTWGPRFMYTGQVALPEAQAYSFKARIYDPVMGRFLQTDPIGQEDDPNLYAYVKGDPTNFSDPSGLLRTCGNSSAPSTTTSEGDNKPPAQPAPVTCGEDGKKANTIDELVVTAAKKKKFGDYKFSFVGPEIFFKVAPDGTMAGTPPGETTTCPTGPNQFVESNRPPAGFYQPGDIPGHTHDQDKYGNIGPDDGFAARVGGGVAYMISPNGTFRINFGPGGYSASILAGSWGVSERQIASEINSWNHNGGKSRPGGVAAASNCKTVSVK